MEHKWEVSMQYMMYLLRYLLKGAYIQNLNADARVSSIALLILRIVELKSMILRGDVAKLFVSCRCTL